MIKLNDLLKESEAEASESPVKLFDVIGQSAPADPSVTQEPIKKRTVYLEDEDITVDYPETMSSDQVNDAIQLEVYGRPRFNFYDAFNPQGAAVRFLIDQGAAEAEKVGGKMLSEPGKAIVRAGEDMLASLGSLSQWFGENLERQADLNDVPDSLGGKIGRDMKSWGNKHFKYWQQQQMTGFEAPDPELFRGSFVSNPSWTRAVSLIAEAIPSLATATAITFATKNPMSGAAALGLTEASGEFSASRESGESLDKSNIVGVSNTFFLTFLERFSLSRFLKKSGSGKPIKEAAVGFFEEGSTEALQTATTNFIARIGYDKTRQIMDGILESFIAGSGSGGIMGGLTAGRAKQVDALIQEAHVAGVSQVDIETVREAQRDLVLAQAEEIEMVLEKEARVRSEELETIPDEELVDAKLKDEIEIIDELIEERQGIADNPEAETEIQALEELKTERQLATTKEVDDRPKIIKDLEAITEKINKITAEGKQPEDSLLKRQEALQKSIESRPTEGRKMTSRIADFFVTQRDTSKKQLVSEMQRLKDKLRAEAKGAKEGFKAGITQERQAARTKIISLLQAHESEIAEVKEGAKQKADILKKTTELKRKTIVDYINKYLPVSERGKFLTMVRDTKNSTDLAKAFARVDKAESDFTRKTIINDIKKQLKKAASAQNISIDYKQAIENMVEVFDLSKPKTETLAKLQATQKFIQDQRAKGNNVEVPEYIYDQLKRLKAIDVNELQTDALFYLSNNIREAIQIGKTKLKTRRAILELFKENRLAELKNGTVKKLETKDIIQDPVTGKVSAPEWMKNKLIQLRNYQMKLGNAILPMDHFFQAMGEAHHRIFKKGIDLKYGSYMKQVLDLSLEVDNLVESLGLNETNFRRIGIYATDQQEGGREKLKNAFTDQEIDGIKLSSEEMQFYKFMRTKLDEIRPDLEKMMAEVYNQPLGKVANYFPFMTDFDAASEFEMLERLSQLNEFQPGAKKNVDLGMTKARVDKKGAQTVKVDALEVFMKHMDDVYYAVEMAEEIKTLQEIAKSPRFANAAGDLGQLLTVEWLDLLARKGGKAGEVNKGLIKGINFLRQNVGAAFMALNPSSIIIQATALGDAAGFIGNYAFKGAYDLASQREWRDFVMDNSPELRNRVGDDFSFREFGQSWLDKMKQGGMAPTRFVDGQTASGVFVGAYQKYLADNGLELDFKNPEQGGIAYAERIVRQTQSSAFFKDLPLFVSKGVGFFNTKTGAKVITQFQGPLFTRFANLMVSVPGAWKAGDRAQAVAIVGSQLVTSAAEMTIRHISKAGWAMLALALFDYEEEEDEDRSEVMMWLTEYAKTITGNVPFVSNFVSLFLYGDAPAPAFSTLSEVFQSMQYALKAKSEGTRNKWAAVMALQAAGIGTGLPLSFKASNLMRKADVEEGELIDDEED